MFQRFIRNKWHIEYTMEQVECERGLLRVSGWMFSPEVKLDKLTLIVNGENEKYIFPLKYGIKRSDTFSVFKHPHSVYSGFSAKIGNFPTGKYEVLIEIISGRRERRLNFGQYDFHGENACIQRPEKVIALEEATDEIDLLETLKRKCVISENAVAIPEQIYEEEIDVLLPVLEQVDSLGNMLNYISKTKMKYRLMIVTPQALVPQVQAIVKEHSELDNVIMISDERTLSYVQWLHKGFAQCKNHIAIVHMNMKLPDMWLERLMRPVIMYPEVFTSNPFSNEISICGFPQMDEMHSALNDGDINKIDEEFRKISPRYQYIPEIHMCCMGINRHALQAVGLPDESAFTNLHEVEADWESRALACGFHSVQVENLYAMYNDKRTYGYLKDESVCKNYPKLAKEIDIYRLLDPNRDIRNYIMLRLLLKNDSQEKYMVFDTCFQGDARAFSEKTKKRWRNNGTTFITSCYDALQNRYVLEFEYKENRIKSYVKTCEELCECLPLLGISQIYINDLTDSVKKERLLELIRDYLQANKCKLFMAVHNYELMNSKLVEEKKLAEFLRCCDEIRVFSEDARRRLLAVDQSLDQVVMDISSQDEPYDLKKEYKTTDSLNIGILGRLDNEEDTVLFQKLKKITEKSKLNIKYIPLQDIYYNEGNLLYEEERDCTKWEILRCVLEQDIDAIFLLTVHPEATYRTVDFVINMGMPIISFAVGAQAERVGAYSQGILIPRTDAKAVVKVLQEDSLMKSVFSKVRRQIKVLFVIGEVSFPSRYRGEHLMEQLAHQGIMSDFCEIQELPDIKVDNYDCFVTYRCDAVDDMRTLFREIHKQGKKVYCDIDDLIFDLDEIRNLEFLMEDNPERYIKYSNNIAKVMGECDGYIVSTFNLKKAVQKSFPDKPVVINRNVASMEMSRLSIEACKTKNSDGIIRLGYFSGSNTHNKDFGSIKDILLQLMEENEKLHLVLGGRIELPADFSGVMDRVEKLKFVSWRRLPEMIAKVDINLMPLEDTFFHACKSENKWMEAAWVKVPTAASWNDELDKVIEDHVDVFLCHNKEEWTSALKQLIYDETTRTRISEKAYQKVRQNYTTYSVEQEVLELFLKEE